MEKIKRRVINGTGQIQRGARAMKGQTMLEFALVAPLFFFLVFALIDYGRLFFVEMDLQNAVEEAGRFASTGNHVPDPNNPGQYLSRVNSIIATAQQAASGASITSSRPDIGRRSLRPRSRYSHHRRAPAALTHLASPTNPLLYVRLWIALFAATRTIQSTLRPTVARNPPGAPGLASRSWSRHLPVTPR